MPWNLHTSRSPGVAHEHLWEMTSILSPLVSSYSPSKTKGFIITSVCHWSQQNWVSVATPDWLCVLCLPIRALCSGCEDLFSDLLCRAENAYLKALINCS